MNLIDAVRTIPDYPKAGIMFRDITTLLGDAKAFRYAVDQLVEPYGRGQIDKVAGMEARGFILGGAVAHQLKAGFIPLRKRGKLPHKTFTVEYDLEYGVDVMEMHCDACLAGERVLMIDDLIAEVVAGAFVIDLPELGGADRLRQANVPVHALIAFEGH
jgi:adenine phosphoribosyltransferase